MERLKQNKSAKFLGISEGYYSKILSGKSVPRPKLAQKLSKKTSSTVTIWLFGSREQKIKAVESAMVKAKEVA